MKTFLRHRDSRFILFDLGPDETSGRGISLLLFVFFGSLIFAAIFTPPLYWLAEWLVGRTGRGEWLLHKGVDVYFDRLRMIAIVLGLPWLMSTCHLWSWRKLGLSLDKTGAFSFTKGWLVGLGLIAGLAFWQHARIGEVNFPNLLNALLAGLILGFLEETIFRGLILRIFYTATRRPWLALALTSAFYAYTHFKVPTSVWQNIAPGAHWHTGLFVGYWTTFGIVVDFNWTQFIVLWLLGLVLGALTLRTGSLLPAIGLHTGLVTAMTFFRGSGLAEGWAAAGALAVLLAMIIFGQAKRTPFT